MFKKISILLTSIVLLSTNISFANSDITKSAKQIRLIGKNRYETSVKVSQSGWSIANHVILVNSNALSDALIVTPLAKVKNAPILLIEQNSIPKETKDEIKRLGAKNITLIGSEGVISKNIENQLKTEGYYVNRIGGKDRIQTSTNIANELNKLVNFDDVVVVNGYKGLADATSIAAAAGQKNMPILYTNGSNLNGIKMFIEQNADKVYIVGSTSVVSKNIESELKRAELDVERIGGKDRKDTNAKVINKFYSQVHLSNVYIAKDGSSKDSELVDGLAVGVLAAKNYSPVILANNNLSQSQKSLLRTKNVKEVVQVGGGVNEKSFNEANSILKNTPKDITYSLSNLEKNNMQEFLDIYIEDYADLTNYDKNDDIDKGRLLEFAFDSSYINYSVEYIDGSTDYDKFMDKRTLDINIIKKHINELFGVSLNIKSGEKYYFEDEFGVNTFTIQNNKVMRYGSFEDRGGCAELSRIRQVYNLSNNEYLVYFDEYYTHDFEEFWTEGERYKAVIKKLYNGKYNLIEIKKING